MSNIPKYKSKLIIVGTVRTGKTCIFKRLGNLEFTEEEESTSVPVNIVKEFTHSQGIISYEIWDTAGQEKYYSVNKFFFKNSTVVIIVYDVTNQDSFDAITNTWLNDLKDLCDFNDLIIILAANKSDLITHEVVKEETGKELAEKIGALFFIVSAKENIGFDVMMNKITEVFFQRGLHLKQRSVKAKINQENEINLNKTKKEKNQKCC